MLFSADLYFLQAYQMCEFHCSLGLKKKKKMKKMSTVWDLSGFQMGNSLAKKKKKPSITIVFLFKWTSLFHLAVISHIFAVPPSDGAEDARPSQLT